MTTPVDEPCGACIEKRQESGWLCLAWGTPLRSNRMGAIRCYDCRQDPGNRVMVEEALHRD
jgi:hypothetical protein